MTPVVLNPKFAMEGGEAGVFPAPPGIFGRKGSAQLFKPILDPQFEMEGGQGDGPHLGLLVAQNVQKIHFPFPLPS